MKSLDRIQKIVRVFKTLSIIGYWCVIVGFVFSVVGAIVAGVAGEAAQSWEWFVDANGSTDVKDAVCKCICGAVTCASSVYILKVTINLYKYELALGTPFEKSLVKKVVRLAVLEIVISVCAAAICGIVSAIFGVKGDIGNAAGVGAGIAYLLLAALIDYGADVRACAEQSASDSEQNN